MERVESFAPVIDKHSRILILGSMPGRKSLAENQYYANPHNQFWSIIYAMFGVSLDTGYEQKLSFIKSRGIALWDVIKNCQREGSLDSHIKNETVNDFERLFREYPELKYIFFNGSKAYETFQRLAGFKFEGILLYKRLSSTSPARTITFEKKLAEWSVLKECLSREID